jgi:threonine/homoserine/homoserine lactone efflux protein
MIEPAALLAWSALALAVTLTPGADTLLVASHAARGGLRSGLAAVAGIQCGAASYAVLFGFGALSVLAATPVLFAIVKIAGAIYLALLGVQFLWGALARKNVEQADAPRIAANGSLWQPLRQGFLSNVLNPKVALFYLAALPQFASGPNAPLIGAMLIGIHALFGASWLSIVAVAASRARAITWNTTLVRWLEGAIGAFFLGVAGRLAFAQR